MKSLTIKLPFLLIILIGVYSSKKALSLDEISNKLMEESGFLTKGEINEEQENNFKSEEKEIYTGSGFINPNIFLKPKFENNVNVNSLVDNHGIMRFSETNPDTVNPGDSSPNPNMTATDRNSPPVVGESLRKKNISNGLVLKDGRRTLNIESTSFVDPYYKDLLD